MKRDCFNCDMETASHVSAENLETVIDGEKIATYLNTDIMKLIELEMDYCKK